MKCLFRALASLAIVLACAGSALAQGWPNRSIRMVVPYTPGGYTDLMARLVGQKISRGAWPARHLREQARRQRHHRHRRRRQGCARRLHVWHRDRGACGERHAQSQAALRHAQGLHVRLVDERRTAHHDCASLVAGEQRERARCAREGQARRTQLCVKWCRCGGASHDGDVQEPHRNRYAAHSLQGYGRRAARYRRRPHQCDVRRSRSVDVAGSFRKCQGDRRHRERAHTGGARGADDGGAGRAGFRVRTWAGIIAPAGTAKGDRRPRRRGGKEGHSPIRR